jgi:hypothetical protein
VFASVTVSINNVILTHNIVTHNMLRALSQEDAPPRTLVLMTGQRAESGQRAATSFGRAQSSSERDASRRAADQLDFVRESLLLCERSSGPELSNVRMGHP